MPELVEQMYCSQQIVIPPKFPYILKRYCKAAIKTQPYDLLRWSFEYFKALGQKRPPPVKLRLEYPVYSTEGGLTRGCLKVLANQVWNKSNRYLDFVLSPTNIEKFLKEAPDSQYVATKLAGMDVVPLASVRAAWQGFCLDPLELRRILCLCEVHMRNDAVPFLNFIAVAAGMLTKSLTHTMILLCETLTKEPDGGSAAILVHDFLAMYKLLARMDVSKDIRYLDGYKEGYGPESISVHEEIEAESTLYAQDERKMQQLSHSRLFSNQLVTKEEIEASKLQSKEAENETAKIHEIVIIVYDEDETIVPYDIFGEPKDTEDLSDDDYQEGLDDGITVAKSTTAGVVAAKSTVSAMAPKSTTLAAKSTKSTLGDPSMAKSLAADSSLMDIEALDLTEAEKEKHKIKFYVNSSYQEREERRENLLDTFDEIEQLVDRFKSASYDLGMVAGRQMSTTSGEFIVSQIEKEIMAYIDEQIGILPDPDLKKKKAKPEEVAMIRDLLETFLDENMEIIAPEIEEVEEEEQPIPEITLVYTVPGIGPAVDDDIVKEFEEYAWDVCKVQADVFMPRNIRHFMCPPLEKYIEYQYEDGKIMKKEELAAGGGVITD